MRGRKPQTREEKVAKGQTRPSRVNYQEPDLAPPDSLAPPRDLKGAGLKLWREHAQKLKEAGALRAADVPLFVTWCRTASDIAEYEGRKDDAAKRIVIQLRNQFVRMSAELGMSPVSRSKVRTVAKAPVEKPKHDRFFGGLRGISGGRT